MPDGAEVVVFTIGNSAGYEIRCMTYGATLIGVKAPGRDGSIREITLGYDRLEDYLAGHPFLGSSVGRVCNRIGGARFALGGREIRPAWVVGVFRTVLEEKVDPVGINWVEVRV